MIDFIITVIEKFPFKMREVRMDISHKFKAKFQNHVEDKGIRHGYIKPALPQLNDKIEHSHRTDEHEFYLTLRTLTSMPESMSGSASTS